MMHFYDQLNKEWINKLNHEGDDESTLADIHPIYLCLSRGWLTVMSYIHN